MTAEEVFEDKAVCALALAVERGELEAMATMLKSASPNAPGLGGMTPTGWAIYRKQAKAFQFLLASGGDPNTVLEDGVTSFLHLGALSPEPEFLIALLERDAQAPESEKRHDHPLHVAALNRRHPHLKLLLEAGAEVDPLDIHGNTPLYYSAGNGDVEGVEALLAAGADPSKENSYGVSPRKVAQVNEQHEVVPLLAEGGQCHHHWDEEDGGEARDGEEGDDESTRQGKESSSENAVDEPAGDPDESGDPSSDSAV